MRMSCEAMNESKFQVKTCYNRACNSVQLTVSKPDTRYMSSTTHNPRPSEERFICDTDKTLRPDIIRNE